MITVGIICDITDNKTIGVIGVEKEEVSFFTKNNELNESIYIILNNKLYLNIEKEKETVIYSISKEVKTDGFLLMGINNYLPFPWKILGVNNVDGNIEDVVNETYKYMEGFNNEQKSC